MPREDNRHPWKPGASPSVGQLSASKGSFAVRRPLSTCTLSLDCLGRPIIPPGTVALSQALSGISECPSARWRRCAWTHQESPRSCLYVPRCNVCPDPRLGQAIIDPFTRNFTLEFSQEIQAVCASLLIEMMRRESPRSGGPRPPLVKFDVA